MMANAAIANGMIQGRGTGGWWRIVRLLSLGLLNVAASLAVCAETPDDASVTPQAVLQSAATHYPKVLAALQKREQAAAERQAAKGAFDLKFKQESRFWAAGYYDFKQVDSKLVKPLGPMGAEAYAGYRIAEGDFPVYWDEYETLSGGEFNFGLVFSLLRDRAIDPRRFEVRIAELDLNKAELELMATRFRVQHKALKAYWKWLAAGRKLIIYRQLLALSERQRVVLEKRLAAGEIASIVLVENQQNVLKRRAKALEAKRDFAAAGTALSLYLRDADGNPAAPEAYQLPADFPSPDPAMTVDVTQDQQRAQAMNADLASLQVEQAQAREKRQLARNKRLPRLDVEVKAARDLGTGKKSRRGTDLIFQVQVEVPLGRRKIRGELAAAQAKLHSLEQEQRLLAQELDTEIVQLAQVIKTAASLVDVLKQEVAQAMALRAAEAVRFEEGASDYFLLNNREERTAESRVRLVEAQYDYQTALADYQAVTVDAEAFGIDMARAAEVLPGVEPR